MSNQLTVSDYIKSAEQALAAGNIDEAETLTKQAEAAAKIAAVKAAHIADQRLPLADAPAPEAGDAAQNLAVKTFFAQRYGDADAGMEQIARELYGRPYAQAAWEKNVSFIKFLRAGAQDRDSRTLLYSPGQIKSFLGLGMTIGEMKATQVEAQDVLGGFLVPEDMRDRLVTRIQGLTVMRPLSTVVSTTRDRVTMPVATGGDDRYPGSVRAVWVDESPTGSQSETNATFGQVTIPVHTLMANTPVSKNLLEDSQGALAIVGILEQQMASAFAIIEDEAFLTGNGVGKPMGILANATTGGPNTYAYGAVQEVNSGGATSLTPDAFKNLPYAIATQYRQAGAKWLMSRGTVRTIKTLKEAGTSGTYYWADRITQLQNGQPPKLEGYDIAESEVLGSPTTASGTTYTANVYPVLFVTQGAYTIIDRIGMDIMRYDDSTTGVQNAIRLVARRRVGGQVTLPWGIAAMKVSA